MNHLNAVSIQEILSYIVNVNEGPDFVTRKITQGVVKIVNGRADVLELGNLDARRDWSHAWGITRGMHYIMQHNEAADFVLASGVSHSVRDFAIAAFSAVGICIRYVGHRPFGYVC